MKTHAEGHGSALSGCSRSSSLPRSPGKYSTRGPVAQVNAVTQANLDWDTRELPSSITNPILTGPRLLEMGNGSPRQPLGECSRGGKVVARRTALTSAGVTNSPRSPPAGSNIPPGSSRAKCRSPEPQAGGGDDGLDAGVHVERLEDSGDVVLDGALREVQLARDHLVGLAREEQREHVGLARGDAEAARGQGGVGMRSR